MTELSKAKYVKMKQNGITKYIGRRFSRLIVLSFTRYDKSHHRYFMCKCDCGVIKEISISHLQSGRVRSCGCIWEENKHEYLKKHGSRNDRLYTVWCGMKSRCNNIKAKSYKNYGGRGITVCEEWNNYIPFRDWSIISGYREGLELDRIDNDKGYSPENCRYTTSKVNANNKRNNVIITWNNETHSLSEWSDVLLIPYTVLSARINKLKWGIEKSFTTEYRPMK